MIRNVALKKIFVNNIFPIFSYLNNMIVKDKNRILIYCSNDRLKDNAGAVFDYLIEHEFYKKYKIVCATENHDGYSSPDKKRVTFIPKQFGIYQYLRSKFVFYSSGKIPIKPSKEQMVINMWHGIPLKSIGKLSNINNGEEFFFTYVCASSEMYRPIIAKAFDCPETNVCLCGEPKTDKLYTKKEGIDGYKLVVWAPTFRQSTYLGYSDSSMSSFLPFIDNSEWDELNDIANNKKIKLIVKLHVAQNLSGFTEKLYSNLEIYSDEAFRKRGLDLYELMARSNALLADYSSVYLEYLLLSRPIGFTLSDINEYKNTRGFVFENPLDYMPGEKLYSKNDLFKFFDNVANGVDDYSKERKRVCDLVHKYQDGKNCARVLEIAGITK